MANTIAERQLQSVATPAAKAKLSAGTFNVNVEASAFETGRRGAESGHARDHLEGEVDQAHSGWRRVEV